MFKKSNNPGDKTPKQENKGDAAKEASATDKSAPAVEKTAASANDDKKS